MGKTKQQSKLAEKRKAADGGEDEGARDYERWKNSPAEACLVEWIQVPDNYKAWKFSKKDKTNVGRPNTSGKTRAAIEREIVEHLESNGFPKSIIQVRNKIKDIESTYKKACELILRPTGEGVTEEDEEAGINSVKDKLLKKCHLFDELHPIFHERPTYHPPHASDNLDELDQNEMQYNGFPEIDMEGVNIEMPADSENPQPEQEKQAEPEHVLPASPAPTTPRTIVPKSNEKLRKPVNNDQHTQPKQQNLISDAIRAAADQKFVLEERRLDLEEQKLKQQNRLATATQEDKKADREFELQKMQLENDRLEKANEKVRLENENLKLKLDLAKLTSSNESVTGAGDRS